VLKPWQFLLLSILASLGFGLVLLNVVLFTGNKAEQNDSSMRGQYIQQSQQLEPLYQSIIRKLAEISAKTNDPQISQLLTSQGITVTVNPSKASEVPAKLDDKGKGK
jgi:hypothetical protein